MGAPRFRYINQQTIRVTNMDMSLASKAQWRAQIDLMAKLLQDAIAESFDNQMVKGTKPLRRNTPRYNAWKARRGFSSKRGHQRGRLQRRLEGKRLFWITAIVVARGKGSAEIHFSDERLFATVPHALYYIQGGSYRGKVPGKKLMVINRAWVQPASVPVFEFYGVQLYEALKRRRMNIANRPRFIRPSLGLTARVTANIRRSA